MSWYSRIKRLTCYCFCAGALTMLAKIFIHLSLKGIVRRPLGLVTRMIHTVMTTMIGKIITVMMTAETTAVIAMMTVETMVVVDLMIVVVMMTAMIAVVIRTAVAMTTAAPHEMITLMTAARCILGTITMIAAPLVVMKCMTKGVGLLANTMIAHACRLVIWKMIVEAHQVVTVVRAHTRLHNAVAALFQLTSSKKSSFASFSSSAWLTGMPSWSL